MPVAGFDEAGDYPVARPYEQGVIAQQAFQRFDFAGDAVRVEDVQPIIVRMVGEPVIELAEFPGEHGRVLRVYVVVEDAALLPVLQSLLLHVGRDDGHPFRRGEAERVVSVGEHEVGQGGGAGVHMLLVVLPLGDGRAAQPHGAAFAIMGAEPSQGLPLLPEFAGALLGVRVEDACLTVQVFKVAGGWGAGHHEHVARVLAEVPTTGMPVGARAFHVMRLVQYEAEPVGCLAYLVQLVVGADEPFHVLRPSSGLVVVDGDGRVVRVVLLELGHPRGADDAGRAGDEDVRHVAQQVDGAFGFPGAGFIEDERAEAGGFAYHPFTHFLPSCAVSPRRAGRLIVYPASIFLMIFLGWASSQWKPMRL